MSEYFPEPKSLGGKVKVELELSNYAAKAYLRNVTGGNTLKFAKRVDLASLESNIEKLNIDKLKNVPSNLNNLKTKVDRLDVDKLVPVLVDLSEVSDVGKNPGGQYWSGGRPSSTSTGHPLKIQFDHPGDVPI